tara:strand:+ start:2502 stop:4691 length:2190 start_codon:yes stop_codon:yes gene_type:complete
MLSFDTDLSNSLQKHSTESFWVLKLYYNAEGSSDFIGVSDKDRTDGSDVYHGVVLSFGNISHSLDFFNFKSSALGMTIKLANTDKAVEGQRFSDLMATKNFANRKWELFQNTESLDTFDTSARMIGTGVISGDIDYNTQEVSFKLLDMESRYNKQIPTNTVSFSNSPEENNNKPIPIAYGDFYTHDKYGTIPSNFNPYRFYNKSAFPAIVTNLYNETNNFSEAKVDSSAIHTLDTDNVYYYNDNYYSSVPSAKADIGSNPTIKYRGKRVSTMINFSGNQSFDVNLMNLSATSGSPDTQNKFIPPTKKLGNIATIQVLTKLGSIGSTLGNFDSLLIGGTTYATGAVTNNAILTTDITSSFTDDQKENWEFDGVAVPHKLTVQTTANTVEIENSVIIITYDLDDDVVYTNKSSVEFELLSPKIMMNNFIEGDPIHQKKKITYNLDTFFPTNLKYVYCSGKGRKYGSWINSRSAGYATTDFIENPVFIIEDILRTELGLTTSEIDETSFNASGNTTNGLIGNLLNDGVADIKFALSQTKFMHSQDFLDKIANQIMSWVFVSSSGKYKIKTLKRTYSSADKTIDFNDINLKSIKQTRLNNVRNNVSVNYNYDYAKEQYMSRVNPSENTTSSGNTVDGYKQSLRLEINADVNDSTTATQIADSFLTILKDRKVVLDFDCLRPKYNDLEIGDIILFSNWSSNIKIYGDSMGTDYYIIQSISKQPDGCSIKAIKVS